MALVVLIERQGFRLAADRAVIKRDEFELVERAADALDVAARQAEIMTNAARQAAQSAGYQDGYRVGRQEAAAGLAGAALARHTAVERLEGVIVQIVVESVGAVLQRIGRERVLFESLSAVREVMRRANWAVLRVPPSSAEAARRALQSVSEELGSPVAVQLLTDAELSDDACVLETDSGVVDAGLGTLLQSVRGAVTGALQGSISVEPLPSFVTEGDA